MQTIGSKSCILIGYGLKSGADQRMLTRELQLQKARFGTKNAILSLVFEVDMMPKAASQSVDEMEEVGPSSVINPQQAEDHKCRMEQTIEDLKENTKEEAIQEIMKDFMESVMMTCREIHTPMMSADTKKVLHSVGDPCGLALRPQTEYIENRLEVIMSEEELPESEDLLQMVSNIEPISNETKEILISMMDHTAEAYHQAAQAVE